MSTTNNSLGTARLISRLTHWGLRQNRINYALIYLNVQITKTTTKLTQICVLSGNINSIESSTLRNFEILEDNWFTQL